MKFAMILLIISGIGSIGGKMINSVPVRYVSGIIGGVGAIIFLINLLRLWLFIF